MSSSKRHDAEDLIERTLSDEGAVLVGYRQLPGGHRRADFTVDGACGHLVFSYSGKTLGKSLLNMRSTLRRLVRARRAPQVD